MTTTEPRPSLTTDQRLRLIEATLADVCPRCRALAGDAVRRAYSVGVIDGRDQGYELRLVHERGMDKSGGAGETVG